MSVAQIARELDVRSTSVVQRWVADLAPPPWTNRPNAKDDLRARARAMREKGRTYPEIAEALGVSKSSVSLWVRDLPRPPRTPRQQAHARRLGAAYWAAENARRAADRERTKSDAARQIGELSERELLLVGAALYWAEGCKDKPYDRRENLTFINSDVRVIRTYLAWLDAMGIEKARRSYRLSIHESADIAAAHQFWSREVGVPVDQFRRPTLKRHAVQTVRLNVGLDYQGCLIVRVAKSRLEYQRMEGIFRAICAESTCLR